LNLDEWQRKVLSTSGNIVLRSGRQVGKSTVIAIKAGEFAVKNSFKTILVIASVERQAYLLFDKILSYLYTNHKKMVKEGKHRPTKSKLQLKNGSVIYCLPTGLSGSGIRGFTVDMLIADEAAFIPDDVWSAVTPMLAVTKGEIILLSTPFGRDGYFYRCFSDKTFSSFHVSSEECSRISKEFLAQEKARMSMMEYAQEYLGEFIDELRQFFPTELIKKCMVIKSKDCDKFPNSKRYLGVDVARMGKDDSVLTSLALVGGKFYQFHMDISSKQFLTDTTRQILHADRMYNYKKIYIDDGGLGVGVFDTLLEHQQTKKKVVPINNSSRALDRDDRKKKLLKEDLYNNLLALMEQNKIFFFDDEEIFHSLRSIQAEYVKDKLHLFGNYSHITEALIRASWGIKDKSLNIFIESC